MSEEIKEILDKLKDGNWYEELDLTGTMWIELRWEETHLLLNYITNLQKENEDYKQRNEKAVEYIEKYLIQNDISSQDYQDKYKKLLNILQGGDEN